MACSQSSTVPTAGDASGLPGSSRVVLGLVGGGEKNKENSFHEVKFFRLYRLYFQSVFVDLAHNHDVCNCLCK